MINLTIVLNEHGGGDDDSNNKGFWKTIPWPVVPGIGDWISTDEWSADVSRIFHDITKGAIIVRVEVFDFDFDKLHPILTAQGWVVGHQEVLEETEFFKKKP